MATGASVLLQDAGGFVKEPVPVENLKSELVSRPVTQGLQSTLPVEGVSIIIGNDLASGRVSVNLRIVEEPSAECNME